MAKPLLILYGSVTGNSECCAEKAAHAARAHGYDPTVESMATAEAEVLNLFTSALIITSTYGDGDPPDGTEDFYETVVRSERLSLSHLHYAVLSLGDSCYEQFCKCGKDYDEALEKRGAVRIHARVDCDTDFDEPAEAWIEGVMAALQAERAVFAA